MRRSTPAFAISVATLAAAGLMSSGIAAAAPTHHTAVMKAELHKLRLCESGGNYHEDTGNGYYGAYQFAPTTWHVLGFPGRPDHAKPATQDRAAKKMHSENGWSAWPSCSHTEHLR